MRINRFTKKIKEKLFLHLIGKDGQLIWSRLKRIYIYNRKRTNYAIIGNHCDLGYEMIGMPENISLEDFTRLQSRLTFISYKGKLHVKKYAAIGAGCIIIPGDHVPTVGVPQYLAGKLHINDVDGEITIGEDAWVGAGTILLSHCQIGRGAVVAAGAVVAKPVPPYAVVAGVPARIIATRFSIEQILEHEKQLYPKDERISREELENIFAENFQGKRAIGLSDMSDKDKERLKKVKDELGMPLFQ